MKTKTVKEYTTEEITEIFFDLSEQGKTLEEIQEITGIKKIEVEIDYEENPTIITIHYPNGEIVSHWV